MRFPLRRNANVLDTLLSETLQIFLIFSIMGWPFSGMQQCETKGMRAERIQLEQQNKQQQLLEELQQQHQHQQQQQHLQPNEQFHKVFSHTTQRYPRTIAMPVVVVVAARSSSRLAFRQNEIVPAVAAATLPAIFPSQASASLSSTVMPSSLGMHDMHSAISIITKDYQHKSAPTNLGEGNTAYTQPTATTTLSAVKKTTTHSNQTAAIVFNASATTTTTGAVMSNENVNGVSVVPADIRQISSLTSPLAALHALHRVSKDTQHSSVYPELLPSSRDEVTNDSHEIDTMDYVMSKHIASLLTHTTVDDDTSMEVRASAMPMANEYVSSSNNSSSNNKNININDYNSSSNNQTQDNLMSLSLLSSNDHNMEISAMVQEMTMDTSLTSSNAVLTTLTASSSPSSSATAAAGEPLAAGAAVGVAAESASLTSMDLSASADSFAGSAMANSRTNRKSAYERTTASNAMLNQTANDHNNMQHLGSQRVVLKTTAKTKTTLATEHQHQHQHQHEHQQHPTQQNPNNLQAGSTAATSGRQQRGSSAKKIESKYILPKPQKTDAPMLNYIFDTFSSANKHHHHDQRYGPHFEDVQRVGQPTNMTVQAGSSIHLNCRISLLQDKTVSWVRRNAQGENALDLLTVGLHTYTGDKRYKMEFQYPNNWRLKITNVKKDDEAMYECQISTHPPRVIQINLFVNAPKVMIVDEFGDPLQEKYYEIDSTLQLSCVVRNVAMATSVVFWKHGDDTLNYDVTRGGISVKTELMDDGANSTLSIAKINKSDSGSYTCAISDFQNFSIVVHILNGESFAELHHGAASPLVPNAFHHQLLVIHCTLLSSLLLLLLLLYAPHKPYILVHR